MIEQIFNDNEWNIITHTPAFNADGTRVGVIEASKYDERLILQYDNDMIVRFVCIEINTSQNNDGLASVGFGIANIYTDFNVDMSLSGLHNILQGF